MALGRGLRGQLVANTRWSLDWHTPSLTSGGLVLGWRKPRDVPPSTGLSRACDPPAPGPSHLTSPGFHPALPQVPSPPPEHLSYLSPDTSHVLSSLTCVQLLCLLVSHMHLITIHLVYCLETHSYSSSSHSVSNKQHH